MIFGFGSGSRFEIRFYYGRVCFTPFLNYSRQKISPEWMPLSAKNNDSYYGKILYQLETDTTPIPIPGEFFVAAEIWPILVHI